MPRKKGKTRSSERELKRALSSPELRSKRKKNIFGSLTSLLPRRRRSKTVVRKNSEKPTERDKIVRRKQDQQVGKQDKKNQVPEALQPLVASLKTTSEATKNGAQPPKKSTTTVSSSNTSHLSNEEFEKNLMQQGPKEVKRKGNVSKKMKVNNLGNTDQASQKKQHEEGKLKFEDLEAISYHSGEVSSDTEETTQQTDKATEEETRNQTESTETDAKISAESVESTTSFTPSRM